MKLVSIAVTAAAIAGFAVTAAASQAQITKVGDAYLFRVKYAKGQTIRYVMSLNMSGASPNGPMSMQNNTSLTVLDVKGRVATIKTEVGSTMFNGKAMAQGRSATVQMDDRGRTLSGNAGGMQVSGGVQFPEKPIHIGESFGGDTNTSAGGMNVKVKTDYRFLGFKTVNGRKVAQIQINLSSGGSVSGKGSGLLLLAVADGSVVELKMNQSVNQANTTARMNIVVERK